MGEHRSMTLLLSLALAVLAHGPACAHRGPGHEAWEHWTKPEGTDQERARDFGDCLAVAQGRESNSEVYRACMVARGWQWNDQPVVLPPSPNPALFPKP